jgi:hypothetical protein
MSEPTSRVRQDRRFPVTRFYSLGGMNPLAGGQSKIDVTWALELKSASRAEPLELAVELSSRRHISPKTQHPSARQWSGTRFAR